MPLCPLTTPSRQSLPFPFTWTSHICTPEPPPQLNHLSPSHLNPPIWTPPPPPAWTNRVLQMERCLCRLIELWLVLVGGWFGAEGVQSGGEGVVQVKGRVVQVFVNFWKNIQRSHFWKILAKKCIFNHAIPCKPVHLWYYLSSKLSK